MSYVLAIELEKDQVKLRLFDAEGQASAITQRFIETEYQTLANQLAMDHIQRMTSDGILSLLQKTGVEAPQVKAVGLVATDLALLQQLNLELSWPLVVSPSKEAFVYGHTCFESGAALAVFEENITVIRHEGMLNGSLGAIQTCTGLEGGDVLAWLQTSMGFIESYADLERMALEVETNLGVYFVPALNGLSMPFEDPEASGLWIGLTRGSNRNHLVRAVQEAFAYQVKAAMDALSGDCKCPATLKVSGAAWLNPSICQTLADVCQTPVEWVQEDSLALRGTAYRAGLAVGVWKTIESLKFIGLESRVYQPKTDLSTAYGKWTEAVMRSKSDFVTVKK